MATTPTDAPSITEAAINFVVEAIRSRGIGIRTEIHYENRDGDRAIVRIGERLIIDLKPSPPELQRG